MLHRQVNGLLPEFMLIMPFPELKPTCADRGRNIAWMCVSFWAPEMDVIARLGQCPSVFVVKTSNLIFKELKHTSGLPNHTLVSTVVF